MADEETPRFMRPAPGHRIPDDEWALVVREAEKFAHLIQEHDYEPINAHDEDQGEDDGEPGVQQARTLLASPRLVTPARKLVPVIDWTAKGRATGKYFPVSGIPTQLLVLHSAECPLAAGYAASVTNWAITTAVQASWHRFVGPDARVYFIPDELGAWHASEANPLSIGWEQAGYAAYTRAQWTTAAGLVQLDSLAYDMAQVAKRDGIPARWLTTAEVRAVLDSGNRSIKGLCTHRQIDPETRTDPGDGYPYDLLLTAIKKYMGATPAPTPPGDDMSAADVEAIKKHINAVLLGPYSWSDGKHPAGVRGDILDAVDEVWDESVARGGKQVSVKQELADAKTLGQQNAAAIKELSGKLDAVLEAVQKAQAPVTPPPATPPAA
jgi:hypothetical protein